MAGHRSGDGECRHRAVYANGGAATATYRRRPPSRRCGLRATRLRLSRCSARPARRSARPGEIAADRVARRRRRTGHAAERHRAAPSGPASAGASSSSRPTLCPREHPGRAVEAVADRRARRGRRTRHRRQVARVRAPPSGFGWIVQDVRSSARERVRAAPGDRVADAAHALADAQETPVSALIAAPFWLASPGSSSGCRPSARQVTVLPPAMIAPTAVHAVVDVHDTPYRLLSTGRRDRHADDRPARAVPALHERRRVAGRRARVLAHGDAEPRRGARDP